MVQRHKVGSLLSLLGVVALVFGIIAFVFGVLLFSNDKDNSDFVNEKLPGWAETDCVFLDFHLADSTVTSSEKDYVWRVCFEYTIEYDIEGAKATVTDTIERTGVSKTSTIPESELSPPHYTGEETFLVFDPDDPSIYRIGSKASIAEAQQQYTTKASSMYTKLIPIGSLLIIVGVFLMLRARKAKKNSTGPF